MELTRKTMKRGGGKPGRNRRRAGIAQPRGFEHLGRNIAKNDDAFRVKLRVAEVSKMPSGAAQHPGDPFESRLVIVAREERPTLVASAVGAHLKHELPTTRPKTREIGDGV